MFVILSHLFQQFKTFGDCNVVIELAAQPVLRGSLLEILSGVVRLFLLHSSFLFQ